MRRPIREGRQKGRRATLVLHHSMYPLRSIVTSYSLDTVESFRNQNSEPRLLFGWEETGNDEMRGDDYLVCSGKAAKRQRRVLYQHGAQPHEGSGGENKG